MTNTANIHPRPPLLATAQDMSEIDAGGSPVQLDALLQRMLTSVNDTANVDKSAIAEHFSNRADFTKPENLIELLSKVSDYNISISLESSLARKAVSAIETLVKG
ncbi:hypothetical protein PHO31112_03945 [Pandoraea horticolens]|uniref:Type III secretion system protein PrgJ n=1 Tax=Pandoraea horticolens TaxID=2508298 RepID=A0A5E4XLU5_9BURK|nr:type III secretion system inner rod subunit SctI [Pandoraea horticolens]VVE37105.1 hypothetical protein PHO31112_03945 [Pandoraea horticolens]